MRNNDRGREKTAPLARPFLFRGGKTGVLLLHGFAGSIADLREFGKELSTQGYTVLGVRLAGHGMSTRDLHNTVAEDWIASARNGLHRLCEICDRVVVLGESMGALLALRLSREDPRVRGAIVLAPAFRLKGERLRKFASRIFPPSTRWRKSWVDDERAARGSLRAITTASYRELMRIVETERQKLKDISVPVLAIFSSKDFVTDQYSREILHKALPNERVRTVMIDEPIHHINEAKDRERLFRVMSDFVREIT